MVRTRVNQGWPRRGFALLWDPTTLARLVAPKDILPLRSFFAKVDDLSDGDLTAADGHALVVSGVEGCLDVLSAEDAAEWVETALKDAVLSFQDFSQGHGGLILWLPSGRNRLSMKLASETYRWKHRPSGPDGLPLGQLLFAGAENEVERLLDTDAPNADYDGKHWIGLHHPRIS